MNDDEMMELARRVASRRSTYAGLADLAEWALAQHAALLVEREACQEAERERDALRDAQAAYLAQMQEIAERMEGWDAASHEMQEGDWEALQSLGVVLREGGGSSGPLTRAMRAASRAERLVKRLKDEKGARLRAEARVAELTDSLLGYVEWATYVGYGDTPAADIARALLGVPKEEEQ